MIARLAFVLQPGRRPKPSSPTDRRCVFSIILLIIIIVVIVILFGGFGVSRRGR
jgi:hypothetical protein